MIRAIRVHAASSWRQEAADTVVLDFDDRHRRRMVMNGVRGLTFLLDLPDALMLRGGDGLELEDGRIVEVVAAPEPLVEVKGKSPRDLVRLAWHIGNRHLSAQLLSSAIRIREDHVIVEMLRGLGATVTSIEAPFDPEGGAYASEIQPTGHDTPYHDANAATLHDALLARHGHRGHKHDHAHHDACGHTGDHAHGHAHEHPHGHTHDH